jgi:type IV pilus assembly protein PilY1
MTRYQKKYSQTVSYLPGLVFVISLVLPFSTQAVPVDLATAPLTNSPTVKIQPNLLFVLDDSGSMAFNYMPDWANSSDQSLFRNVSYNTIAYNPAIRYTPPAFFDASGLNTTKYPSQTGTLTANWKNVKDDAYLGSSTSDLTASASNSNSARFYTITPGEYCKKRDLKECNTQTASTPDYPYPAPVRWCNTATNASAAVPPANSCQATKLTGFTNLRAPGQYTATIKITSASSNPKVNGIIVDNQQIMSAPTFGGTSNTSSIAQNVVTSINLCTNNITGSCTVAGYSASNSGSVITISAPRAITLTPALSPAVSIGTLGTTITTFAGGTVPGAKLFTPIFSSTLITGYPYPGSAVKAATRTDCVGTTCTYDEEMTNYANWWTYYQTRLQTMKTAASLAFKDIGEDFRVGFMTIWATGASKAVKFDTFNTAQKAAWYGKFFGISAGSSTPLRSALSKAGRIYAKKETLNGVFTDPVEYACQQNFTLITTDGFWNTDYDSKIQKVDGAQVGDQDSSLVRPYYEGPVASFNSLADVAKYYYDTDLRDSSLGNSMGALGIDVSAEGTPGSESYKKQNMATLTLGLGVDGTLAYISDYKTATSGDYFDIKNGGTNGKDWPVPVADSPTAVDDLWHAAVNGGGTYFSAKNPTELASSLKEALASIKVKSGAGAAAATSTKTPVSGNNAAYSSSFATGDWIGNLEKHAINLTTGATEDVAIKCVEDVAVNTSCASPSSIVGTNCETPGVLNITACPAPGTLVGSVCKVPLGIACTGTLKNKVNASIATPDTRTILMNSGGNLVNFAYANLSAAQQVTFQSKFLAANLSQWDLLTPSQQANATENNLINYLRGIKGYEEGSSDPANRIFRKRQTVLGDAIDSKPVFVGEPLFSYTDTGYAEFKVTQKARPSTVYLGANDGMLHAFDADTLEERWAYVPSMVIPNMWKLADSGYASKHSYYADGNPVISYICNTSCSSASDWKTILVAGLNGGGRGYYALDITNPLDPKLLWEFDAIKEPNLGYTFGNPVITKRPDGKWVVLVTSGYNNIPDNDPFYALSTTKFKPYNTPATPLYTTGDGKGYLYVLDAINGKELSALATGETITPSGLAKITAYSDSPDKNNTSTYVYGGDLLGNLWRFNLVDNKVLKFATLKAGAAQPITTEPTLGYIQGKRVVFVGTGKYLEVSDLVNTNQQTLYAIKDNDDATTLVDPRSILVKQTLASVGTHRNSTSNNPVDWGSGFGWYIDFPDAGERENVAPQFMLGMLFVPSLVPTSSACQPSGYGWFNYLDYATGGSIATPLGVVSDRTDAPISGFYTTYDSTGVGGGITDTNGKLYTIPHQKLPGSGQFMMKRSIWRELIK